MHHKFEDGKHVTARDAILDHRGSAGAQNVMLRLFELIEHWPHYALLRSEIIAEQRREGTNCDLHMYWVQNLS